jgi:uncharacterized membrane protein YqgA involved in biofilm formation
MLMSSKRVIPIVIGTLIGVGVGFLLQRLYQVIVPVPRAVTIGMLTSYYIKANTIALVASILGASIGTYIAIRWRRHTDDGNA